MKILRIVTILLALALPAYAEQTVEINGETFAWDGARVVEPDCAMDPYATPISQATDAFGAVYPVTVSEYALCAGADTETFVTKIEGEKPGKTVYVVAGIHGDERAAWFGGVLLKQATIACGTLYILAPANVPGAGNCSRYVTGGQDLNRAFPGSADGTEAGRLAYAIYRDIESVRPDFVFDLHEAIGYHEGVDFLGSTLIYTRLDGMEDMFMSLLLATQLGEICSAPFGYNGPGPEGSINRTVADTLQIPIVTVETFRGYPMARRVRDQLDIVAFALRYLGLLP